MSSTNGAMSYIVCNIHVDSGPIDFSPSKVFSTPW